MVQANGGNQAVVARLRGMIAPVPTVFDGRGEVDVPAMEALTDWYIEKGVHGFFLLGSQGQGPACRVDQRKLVAATVVRRVGRRVPVMAQVGAVEPYTSMELASHAREIGADAVAVVGPYFYNDRSEWEFIEHHKWVNEASGGLPMFLYNNPAYSGYPTTPAMMATLREALPNVFGAKLATGTIEQAVQYLRVLGREFSIFIPISQMIPGMLLGVRGSVAAGLPVTIPEIGVQLVEAVWAGELELALKIELLIADHMERMGGVLRQYGRSRTLVGLQIRGLPVQQYPRWPTKPVASEHRELAKEAYNETLKALEALSVGVG